MKIRHTIRVILLIFLFTGLANAESLFIDLDPNNNGGASPDFSAEFTEGSGPLALMDSNAVIEDTDNMGINSLIITLVNMKTDDILTVDTEGTGIIFQYDQGVLSLSAMNPGGMDTAENYQKVLRTVKFDNSSQNPDTSPRLIEFKALSGEYVSNIAVCTLTVLSVNTAPVNTIPGPQITPENVPLIFSSTQANRISVSDVDGRDIRVNLSIDQGILIAEDNPDLEIEGSGTSSLIITGPLGLVNDELDGLRYEPPLDWQGSVNLTMETSDLGNTGSPGPLSDIDFIEITAGVTTGPNDQPPSADAGEDQTVDEYRKVFLDGSNSSDPEGEIAAYEWIQIEGNPVILSSSDTAFPFFNAPEVDENGAVLSFQLTVTDSKGQNADDTVKITINDAGEVEGLYDEGTTVSLNEEGASCEWLQLKGPLVNLSDAKSCQPFFVTPSVGIEGETLIFQVTMGNKEDGNNSKEIIIRVNDNGISGFPDDVLTFRNLDISEMGIKLIDGTLIYLNGINPDEIENMENKPANLPSGLINTQIQVNEAGDTAAVEIYFSKPAEPELKWFQYNETTGWSEYGDAVFSQDRNYVLLSFTDGGSGDNDGEVNGIIQTFSGPGKLAPAGGAGDSGGGCFILDISTSFINFISGTSKTVH